jgi:hypothetical protein
MQPTPSDVHVDAVLTAISVAYRQRQTNFIAGSVFPVIPVDKQSDKYYVYTKNDWFRDEAALRGPATESAGSGFGLSTATYSADVFAIHKDVDDQMLANADAPLNPESDAAEFVTQRLLLRREIQWVADYFTTSVWGTDSTPSNLWSDYANSDPVSDAETGKRTVLLNTGFEPNTLVLGYDTWRYLKHHPDIIARLGFGGSAADVRVVMPQQLAAVFEVDRVMIAKAVKATNVEAETAAYSFVAGKHALLCYAAPSPGLLAPSAGYTFAWRGANGGMMDGISISRERVPLKKATRIEGEMAWDNKVVGSDLGYFFPSAVV